MTKSRKITMKYLPPIQKNFNDVCGIPLDGGRIEVRIHDSTNFATIYSDADGTAFAPNPYVINVAGEVKFFVDADAELDYYVYDDIGYLRATYSKIKVNSCENGGGSGPSGDVEWDDVKNKPSAFPPSAHRHNASEIYNLPSVPTKTSQLKNDSGYITSEEIPAIPTKTSELTNDSGYITGVLVSEGLYYTSDGKLTTTEPEGNFIDITNEWEFLNGFKLQYNGNTPGINNVFKVMYSPISDTVKFSNDMRINRTTPIESTSWNRFLYYTGNRFYDSYNAPTPDLKPSIGITPPYGGMILVPGSDPLGVSVQALCTMSYLGDSSLQNPRDAALGFKLFYSNNVACYGIHAANLVLKVHKKV